MHRFAVTQFATPTSVASKVTSWSDSENKISDMMSKMQSYTVKSIIRGYQPVFLSASSLPVSAVMVKTGAAMQLGISVLEMSKQGLSIQYMHVGAIDVGYMGWTCPGMLR